ncbi:NRAMP family divalent metal transporter [Bradyrhizobium sp.]|uniref:NRAMP family divalent metal transporter n=1 Tax=Bradyrhizobium sp. TaxID=376 RepID=UPI003D0C15BC
MSELPAPAPEQLADIVTLTPEDLSRSRDRMRVLQARKHGGRPKLLWLLTGPGILVMLGENDGPSMLSYAASGATYGIGFFLPFIVATFLASFVVQEMSMRIGAVTHRGYGELIFQRFGPFWGWISAADLVLTNLITLVTEVIAIRVGMGFFAVPPFVAVGCAVLLVAVTSGGARYWRWERLAMALALFNLLFVAVAVLSRPSPCQLVDALVTWTPLPTGPFQGFLLILASNIGATVTPWMLFFQQSASVDKGLTPKDIPQGRLDTAIGTALAALAGCAALVAAAPLFVHHVDSSSLLGGAGYAEALQPLIGGFGSGLFALGLIEAGAVAMLTISASTAYAVGEVLSGSAHSFNRTIRQAPLFYAANIGMALFAGIIVLIPGMPLLTITLNANLLATILMPAALVFLLVLANDREIMGARVNSGLTNVFGALIALLVTLAGSSYAILAFINSLSPKGS